jgi:nucleoid DNA-binding protein
MQSKGIAYDTGFIRNGVISRERFDPEVVQRELAIIRDDLHCNAVQIIGGDPDRLELAATQAAELGLEVWLSPYPLELTTDEIRSLLIDCAARAERLRQRGANVVFVAGVELSIMNRGFFPGRDGDERLGLLLSQPPDRRREQLREVGDHLNEFFGDAVPAIRERFRGRVTYAAIPTERVDWTRFDIVSLELIRTPEVADQYREAVRKLVAEGKPVAITGFGGFAYRGARERGARAMEIVECDPATGAPVQLDGEYIRDEQGQATDIAEVLGILDIEGVDSAFVFLFALENYPHRPDADPRYDLDMASPGIVKTLEDRHGNTYPDMAWEPKAAFAALAEFYQS